MRIIIIFISLLYYSIGLAQENPLKKAERLYYEGKCAESEQLLLKLLENDKLRTKDNIRAFELIIQNRIELNQTEKIDSIYKIILKHDPYYEPNKEFVQEEYLSQFKQYYTFPKFSFGFSAGLNNSMVMPYEIYETYEKLDYFNAEYTNKPKFIFGLDINWNIKRNHRLSLFMESSNIEYQKITKQKEDDIYLQESLKTTYNETIKFYSLGLGYQYYLLNKKKWEVLVGATYRWLFNSTVTANANVEYSSNNEIQSYFSKDFDIKETRKPNYQQLGLSLTSYLKFKQINPFIKGSFYVSQQNFVDENKRYNNDELSYHYYHAEDNFRVFLYDIRVGILVNVHYKIKRNE